MLSYIYITPPAGINYVQNASWAFVKCIVVTMDDMVIDLRDAPANRICQYIAAEGKVLFNDNFNGLNKVTLLFKVPSIAT